MKQVLEERLVCPECNSPIRIEEQLEIWRCSKCATEGGIHNRAVLFSRVAKDTQPFDKQERSPDIGTPWRKANWRFLQMQTARLRAGAVILDIGAGRGDFAAAFKNLEAVLLDVYPYPEVDVVCDLTRRNPFRPGSFDAVVLMNVLEHVYDTRALFAVTHTLLKPGGVFLVAVPFLLKIHQAPFDFVRYTHFSLEKLGVDHGFELETLEGYYDAVFLLGEGWRNIERWIFPEMSRANRVMARGLLAVIKGAAGALPALVGGGSVEPAQAAKTPSPIGYHVVYRKPL